jgi:adenylosuccinate synthase
MCVLLVDFFRIQDIEEADITQLRRVMVFTCKGEAEPITVNHLECKEISEVLAKKNAVPFHEIGPSFSMRIRRDKLAAHDLFKEACRKPKITNVAKKKAKKNMYTNELGETHGKVFIQQ